MKNSIGIVSTLFAALVVLAQPVTAERPRSRSIGLTGMTPLMICSLHFFMSALHPLAPSDAPVVQGHLARRWICPVVWEGRRREASPYPDQSGGFCEAESEIARFSVCGSPNLAIQNQPPRRKPIRLQALSCCSRATTQTSQHKPFADGPAVRFGKDRCFQRYGGRKERAIG